MAYTVKEIADLAGVSTRTIRYYGEVRLLKPAEIRDNGYRYYNNDSLLQLQQILFFREMDFSVNEIARIISQADFDKVLALEQHRDTLLKKKDRLKDLIGTVDRTIEMLRGKNEMTDKEIFKGFDEAEYDAEARERWGSSAKFTQSRQRWNSYSEAQKKAIKAEISAITRRMVGEGPGVSPEDPEVQKAVKAYFDHLNKYFYTCDLASFRALSDLWVEDARFSENYERVREGGANFVRKAVHHFCDQDK